MHVHHGNSDIFVFDAKKSQVFTSVLPFRTKQIEGQILFGRQILEGERMFYIIYLS